MTDPKTLVLVDGSSYLYRVIHALPGLRVVPGDARSAATGAIRGMINMLQALRKERPADYAACVFDASGPTFRDSIYPEYKARRAPMPEDLRAQIAPTHEAVRLLGWPVLAIAGGEADDVIGTLAVTAAAQGMQVLVSSGDKDLSQLVNQHITIVDTMSGKKRDVAGAAPEFGVPPQLMVDYQTLMGDAVDNVPGVPKVGPKTAAKWLQEYGSLDALLAHAHEIKGVVGENLRGAIGWLPTGRQLVTIRTDCDLAAHVPGLPALDALAMGAPQVPGLRAFYEKYGFKGLARALQDPAPPALPLSGATGDLFADPAPHAPASPPPPHPPPPPPTPPPPLPGPGPAHRAPCLPPPPPTPPLPGTVPTRRPRPPGSPWCSTNRSWTGRTSSNGCSGCNRPIWWRWTPKPIRSTKCGRRSSASRCACSLALRPTSRCNTAGRMRPRNCPSAKCWHASNPGWKMAGGTSWASTSSTTAMCLPTTASRCRAMCTTPCCKAMCWRCTSRTTWAAWPSATPAARASAMKTCAARARTSCRLPRCGWTRPPPIRAKTPT